MTDKQRQLSTQRTFSIQDLIQLTRWHANQLSQASLTDATKLQLILNHLSRMCQIVRFQIVSNHSVVFSLNVYHHYAYSPDACPKAMISDYRFFPLPKISAWVPVR